MSLEILVTLIVVALAFDFMNGFHDAANSIATIVSTGAMSPQAAVVWAAFFNFIAFLFFGVHVAATVGKGIVDTSIVDAHGRAVFHRRDAEVEDLRGAVAQQHDVGRLDVTMHHASRVGVTGTARDLHRDR